MRRRTEWIKWVPKSARFHGDLALGLQSSCGLTYGALVSSFQKVTVEEGRSANQNSLKGKTEAHTDVLGRAEEFTGESLCNGRVQTLPQAGADHSTS